MLRFPAERAVLPSPYRTFACHSVPEKPCRLRGLDRNRRKNSGPGSPHDWKTVCARPVRFRPSICRRALIGPPINS